MSRSFGVLDALFFDVLNALFFRILGSIIPILHPLIGPLSYSASWTLRTSQKGRKSLPSKWQCYGRDGLKGILPSLSPYQPKALPDPLYHESVRKWRKSPVYIPAPLPSPPALQRKGEIRQAEKKAPWS